MRLEREIAALEQQRAEGQFWVERHQRQRELHRRFEALQRVIPHTTPATKKPPHLGWQLLFHAWRAESIYNPGLGPMCLAGQAQGNY